MKRILITILSALALITCSTQPSPPHIDYSSEDLIYMDEYKTLAPAAKIGSPYRINDDWYFPMHQPSYDKTGVASWYGPGLDGHKTANGEILDRHDYTAAHPTLPIPSIVEITNLDNGKKVNVRINDRGPYSGNRIIDVSEPAAKALGMMQSGTAHVRVRVLDRETLEYLQYAKNTTANGIK